MKENIKIGRSIKRAHLSGKVVKCFLTLICSSVFISCQDCIAEKKPEKLEVTLADNKGCFIEGEHRFVEIAGIKGLHVKSLKTEAYVETSALDAEKGTVSFWMSPLEDIDKSPKVGEEENIMNYPLLSDTYPPRDVRNCNFSVYYQGTHYPRVIGRFTNGKFWGQMDFGMAPFVYAEELPLEKGQWYHFVITWEKLEKTLKMYINGQMVGHNYLAGAFKESSGRIYIGNPLMVISHLVFEPEVLSEKQIKKEYLSMRPETNTLSDETIKEIGAPRELPKLKIELDKSWEKVYECSFSKPSDLNEWKFQTGDLYRDKFKLETSADGLYWETPDIIHTESRGYLWSPVNLEGDHWVEYEFQLVSQKGLALLILCASGLQGEDIIEDHGLKKTGSMGDMLMNYRNYHWEYIRRVEAMRTDVETQYVNKNPWGKSLYVGCIPRLEQNKWYKIRFIKMGDRLMGSLDGETVFDITDNAFDNNGPGFNSGRIVLRQMYHTAMKYRNFKVYKKIKSN